MHAPEARPVDPHRPDLRCRERDDAAAVTMTFNGVEYRAVLSLGAGGRCRPGEVAAMLRRLADEVEAE
jgi:hypothetical protein